MSHRQTKSLIEQHYQPNPDNRDAFGLSKGFQRTVLSSHPVTQRDRFRMSLSGTTPTVITEPIQRAGLDGFRSDSLMAVVEHACVERSSSTLPVLINMNVYQANSAKLTTQGQGVGFVHDTVIACINPNFGITFLPTHQSSGAQVQLSNLTGNPITWTITDLQGNLITDLTAFYVSLVLFEKQPEEKA